MTKKSSSATSKNTKIDNKNKALYKATSLLPTNSLVSVPSLYVRTLPMIIAVVAVVVLMIIPLTRNSFVDFSKNTANQFSIKTDLLQANLILSLQAGLDAYVNQIKDNVKILPIDSDLESKKYLGRAHVTKYKKVETESFAEKAHYMTASISQSFGLPFEYFR